MTTVMDKDYGQYYGVATAHRSLSLSLSVCLLPLILQLQIQRKQMPLVGFFFASMIFMISVLSQKGSVKWYGYAVSVGVLGMFLAVVGLLMLKYASELPHKYLAYLCLTWSFIGALLLTFAEGSPFKFTGNGKSTRTSRCFDFFSFWLMGSYHD